MRSSNASLLALATTVLILAGCDALSGKGAQSGMTVKNPIATVNNYKVSPEMMDVYAEARTRQKFSELPAEQQQEILDEALKLVAIAEDARAKGLNKDPEIAARIELQTMNVLAQSRIGDLVENASITDAALQAAYEQEYVTEPKQEYKARHILVKSEEEAQGIIKELDGGADFAELAKAKSIGPSASKGGDLGWFARDAMVKPFADAVASMESGQYSKTPVQTQFGYHVILSEGSRVAPPPTFDSVKETLRGEAQQKVVEDYIDSTRKAAKVNILIDMKTPTAVSPEPADDEPAVDETGE